MARRMKKLTVYECQHCKKLFKTIDRHICKFDPDFKNCHSCKFCAGFKEEDREGGIDVGIGVIPTDMLYPICEKDCSDYSAKDIANNGYVLNCDKYEYCGGRWVDYRNNKQYEKDCKQVEEFFNLFK